MFDGIGRSMFHRSKLTAKCNNCDYYNVFKFDTEPSERYCSACQMNPYGKLANQLPNGGKPHYKWSWKLNKAVRL